MSIRDDSDAMSKVVERVIGAVGIAMALAILGMLPWTGKPWYYAGMDAVDVLAPILLVRFVRVAAPKWYLSKAFAPAGNGGRPPVAGMFFFLPLTAWVMTAGYFLISLGRHGSAPGRSVIASAANSCLASCLLVGSSVFYGRRKPDDLVDGASA